MASTTPNIGLTLPTGAEKVSRQIINDNNTKIDTAIGTLNSKIAPAISYSTYTALHLGDFTPPANGFLMIQVWVNASKTFTLKVGTTKLFEWFVGSAGNATAQIPIKAGTTVTITTDDSISSSAEVGKFVAT